MSFVWTSVLATTFVIIIILYSFSRLSWSGSRWPTTREIGLLRLISFCQSEKLQNKNNTFEEDIIIFGLPIPIHRICHPSVASSSVITLFDIDFLWQDWRSWTTTSRIYARTRTTSSTTSTGLVSSPPASSPSSTSSSPTCSSGAQSGLEKLTTILVNKGFQAQGNQRADHQRRLSGGWLPDEDGQDARCQMPDGQATTFSIFYQDSSGVSCQQIRVEVVLV